MRLSSFQLHATPNSYTLQQTQMFQLRTIAKVLSSQTPFQSCLQARQTEHQASERGQSPTTSYILLLRTLDGDARHRMKAAALRRTCGSPKSLFLREVSFGHVSRLTTSWSGQSWSRCWLVIGAVSQEQRSVWPVLSLQYM